jgi:quercetin dioxygenase-like cupin family protein
MALEKIPFASLPFVQGAHPLERKTTGDTRPIGVLEFAPGFADPNWCRRAHVVFVLQGVLTFELEHAREHIATGESCVIGADTPHRARNDGSETVLAFVASDVSWSTDR